MQPSPSLSQLMKRRRRRCGGVFKPVEGAYKDFAVEYDWPYQRPARASAPKLSIDTSTANEAFFRRSNIEMSRFSSSSDSSSSALEMKHGGRKYSFERDSDTVRVGETAERNLATRDGASTRSPSVYSQGSDKSLVRVSKQVDWQRGGTTTNEVIQPAKPLEWPERSSSLATPKLRSRVGNSFNNSNARTHTPKQDLRSVKPEVKLTRSSLTRLESIRRVSSKLGARTRSFTNIITEKVSDLKIGEGRPRRAAGGQEDSKDGGGSSEVGSSIHALAGNAEHGPMRSTNPGLRRDHAGGDRDVRRFFSSGRQKDGHQRKVY